MQHVHITIAAVGDPKTFPELEGKEFIGGEVVGFSILEKGTAEGHTSTALHVALEDGKYVTLQLTASTFLAMAGAVRGACQRFKDTKNA